MRKKTECKRDHPLYGPDADVYVYKANDGYVVHICRVCQRMRQQIIRDKIKADYEKKRKKRRKQQ